MSHHPEVITPRAKSTSHTLKPGLSRFTGKIFTLCYNNAHDLDGLANITHLALRGGNLGSGVAPHTILRHPHTRLER